MNQKKIHLVLRHHVFDGIQSGQHHQAYCLVTDKWKERLIGRQYGYVTLQRGCTSTSATYRIISITIGKGHPDWGAPASKPVFIIKLGSQV